MTKCQTTLTANDRQRFHNTVIPPTGDSNIDNVGVTMRDNNGNNIVQITNLVNAFQCS